MAHKTDAELIEHVHNTARFFVEQRPLAWAALIAVAVWGAFGYFSMPQRKDPEIPVRVAVAACQWPGATAQQVEQLVTKPIEQTIAQNKTVHPPGPDTWGIRSISLPGASFVYVQLSEDNKDNREQFSDINLKLEALNGRLPQGASPVQFQSDFGDTTALMLTVASPPVDELEIELRAQSMEETIRSARSAAARSTLRPVSLVLSFPLALSQTAVERVAEDFRGRAEQAGVLDRARIIRGRGFIGIDAGSRYDDSQLSASIAEYIATRLQPGEIDPDVWLPVIVRDPAETAAKLAAGAGSKYSYAELDNYTDLIGRTLLGVPQASRVERKGILPQTVYLSYSQERLAAYGLQVSDLSRILYARNITLPGGSLQAGARQIRLDPSGEFEDARSIGNVVVSASHVGAPVYLRDLVEINSAYRSPPDYLNYYTWTERGGKTHRSRAITLALYMREGEQIEKFGAAVNEKLDHLRDLLPRELIIARTSDQPLQAKENVDLFMGALYEAVGLVVLIALIGFWEWRSAFLMALSIPITLALTFGIAHTVGVDLQLVSIGALIVALGLLVDDPVVANNAIKGELAAGAPRLTAAWLGPTKLARAILYATATNIIAYLPFLMVTGSTGDFLRTLPIVMTAALVASRLVSMTFIPLLSYYLLRPGKKPEPTIAQRRERGFYGFYYRLAGLAIRFRWAVLAVSLVFLAAGAMVSTRLKSQFFPDDVQYWSYVDVWLPNNAPLPLTNETAQHAEQIVRRVTAEYERQHPGKTEKNAESEPLLKSVTTFVGGGGPRFWFSVSPEQQQPNYAQVLIQLSDKEATPRLAKPLQAALSQEIPGAFLIVHQLQINPVEFPVEVRISGVSDIDPKEEPADNRTLRDLAGQVQDILRSIRGVQVAQNDWFAESPEVQLKVDADRANLAGVTNRDVAASTAAAISGATVTTLHQGNLQIPVVARLIPQERAQLSDIQNLYVYSSTGQQKVPLRSVSSIEHDLETERIRRQEHFRTIGVHAWPQPGVLPSEVLQQAMPQLREFARKLPANHRMEIGGEMAKQKSGFDNLVKVLIVSMVGIYAALLVQFNSAVKPLLVFAATPYGVVGALLALAIMGSPFGFMAFLGVASLIGVIVSHVIVLFDFIEEMHDKGEPFEQAIRDAGIERLRPVLITVGATILALFPLASHGGPLWQPLCYAQIGGLAVATFITLLLVPVFYSIAVLDLKIVKWVAKEPAAPAA
jgi:multidrug efflux pump subunit AcrB